MIPGSFGLYSAAQQRKCEKEVASLPREWHDRGVCYIYVIYSRASSDILSCSSHSYLPVCLEFFSAYPSLTLQWRHKFSGAETLFFSLFSVELYHPFSSLCLVLSNEVESILSSSTTNTSVLCYWRYNRERKAREEAKHLFRLLFMFLMEHCLYYRSRKVK